MRRLFLAFLSFVATAAVARAQSTVVTEHARTSLIAEADGVAPGGVVALAFAQQLQNGWHVYWRNPGDSGLPLEFKWTLPEGSTAGPIDYPTPERIPVGPLVNFGHVGAPIFLTSVAAPADARLGSTLDVGLEATWLICEEICVPETGRFSLSIPVVSAPEKSADAAPVFEKARAATPAPLAGDAYFSVGEGMVELEFVGGDADADDAWFFPAMDGLIEPAAAQRIDRRQASLLLSAKAGPTAAAVGETVEGVVVLERNDGERRGFSFTAERRIESAVADGVSLGGLFGAAFLGGVVLNLMPCVFPILFVKAASMAEAAQGRSLRRHGVVYALGVVATFAALGGLLIALRAGGAALGWGFHLQSPAVIALSAYVLFAVGLNLSGAFSIGQSLQNVGSGFVLGRRSDAAAFMTGALAVFVAAPCVGPFLTAPIGAAAILPPAPALMIFVAMALGLAAPYVALAFWPGARRLLPKPGRWMERFRQALAFPVFAAAGFFLWVLAAQTGARGLALALAGVLLLALAARFWEWGRGANWGKIAAALALAAALAPVVSLRPAEAKAAAEGRISFDPADVELRRAAGEPVFIDFTAAWCVTCQVNKLTVLSSPKVKAALRDGGVAFVTADWTNRDPVIEKALAAFGANGVPLYVYYPPGGEAVILPQPLTERSVLSALRSEKGDEG